MKLIQLHIMNLNKLIDLMKKNDKLIEISL